MNKDKFGAVLTGRVYGDNQNALALPELSYTLSYELRLGEINPVSDATGEYVYVRDDMTLLFSCNGYVRTDPVDANDYFAKRAISPLDMPTCYVEGGYWMDTLLGAWMSKQYNVQFRGADMKLQQMSIYPYGSNKRAYALLGKALDWYDSTQEQIFIASGKLGDETYMRYSQLDTMAVVLWRLHQLGVRMYQYGTDPRDGKPMYHKMERLDKAVDFTLDNLLSWIKDTNRRLAKEW